MNVVTGATGLLGREMMKFPDSEAYPCRLEEPPVCMTGWQVAFLCAGTKGFAECEGNRKAFRSDVDGNIRLIRHLHQYGVFVIFVSTDAVEVALNTAYARNRFFVELAVGGLHKVAIFRPGKFTKDNVALAAKALWNVGHYRIEGLTRWP